MGYEISFSIERGDFNRTFGRQPKNAQEFDQFACLCEKGLRNGHIDWDIVFECAKVACEDVFSYQG